MLVKSTFWILVIASNISTFSMIFGHIHKQNGISNISVQSFNNI